MKPATYSDVAFWACLCMSMIQFDSAAPYSLVFGLSLLIAAGVFFLIARWDEKKPR